MTDTHDAADGGGASDDSGGGRISRRQVLATTGAATVGVAAFSGSASAHEVSAIAFCGCSQVTVWGIYLTGNPPEEEDVAYHAIVYCDGELYERPLDGDATRQNYDVHADETLEGECQIIGVTGTSYPYGEFTICNQYCSANCAARGLDDVDLDCDDPSSVEADNFDGITVQCQGCGRPEPGHPGNGNGPPENPGKGGGRSSNSGKGGGRR